MITNIDKYDIMQLTGYSKTQAQRLMRQAKAIMVANGFEWYAGKRISRVPIQAIEQILGFKITPENDIINGVQVQSAVIGKDSFNDSKQG
jgi:hypothetical protein